MSTGTCPGRHPPSDVSQAPCPPPVCTARRSVERGGWMSRRTHTDVGAHHRNTRCCGLWPDHALSGCLSLAPQPCSSLVVEPSECTDAPAKRYRPERAGSAPCRVSCRGAVPTQQRHTGFVTCLWAERGDKNRPPAPRRGGKKEDEKTDTRRWACYRVLRESTCSAEAMSRCTAAAKASTS